MRPDTEAFLSLVRDAEDPTLADAERVERALRAAVAAGAMPSAPGKLGVLGSKLNVLAVCAAAAAGTADTPVEQAGASRSVERSAVVVAAPLPPPSELAPGVASREEGAPASEPDQTAGLRAKQAPPAAANAELRRARRRPPAAPRVTAANEPDPSGLAAELELLQRVQAALRRGDAASALEHLDAHHTLDRRLLAEREAARVIALCLLQRTAEARSAARDFSARHPDSMHRQAIASACANLQRIGEP